MTGAVVLFHRLAGQEFVKARRWYLRRSPGTASRFRQAVNEVTTKIADDPERWPFYDAVHRWIKLSRFPYILVFRPGKDIDTFVVVAVAHTRRRQGYWRRRKTE